MNELVRLTRRCNNRCVFCRTPGGCGPAAADEDPAAVLRRLRELREAGSRRVVLAGGEPTVTVALSLAVAEARALGFDEIAIKTNGRRLAHGPYTERLVRGGLTHALVSLQSHLAEVHDALTRTPGSFAEATDGMLELRGRGVRVSAVLVLTRQNCNHLRPYLDLVHALGAEAVTLRTLAAAPRGTAPPAGVSVPAGEAAPLMRAAVTYGAARGLRMTTSGLSRSARERDLRYYQ